MAITLKVEPQEHQSAFNEVMIVLDSDKKAEPKFQYIVDITVNGNYSSRLKIQSNPQGYGVMNIGKHLESYVKGQINILNKQTFKTIPNSFASYSIALKEEYVLTESFTSVTNSGGLAQYNFATLPSFEVGDYVTIDGSGIPTLTGSQLITSKGANYIITTKTYAAATTGTAVLSNNTPTQIDSAVVVTSKYILNNVVDWLDVPTYDSTEYICTGLVSKHLTSLPQEAMVYPSDRNTMNIYNKITDNAAGLEVITSRGMFRINNSYSTSIELTKFLSVGVGVFDLENTSDTVTVVSGSLPMFDSSVNSYTVRLIDNSNNPIGEERRFNVNNRCSDFDGTRMIYLNRDGSYSTFHFALNSTKKFQVAKKSFNSNFGSYDSAANSYGYGSSESGMARLDTKIKETYNCQSDYMHERDGNMIQELMASPEVYILENNNTTLDSSVAMNRFSNTLTGLVQLSMSAPHNMVVGDMVTLQGFAEDTMKGSFRVNEIVDATSLIIEKGASINGYNCISGESVAKEIFSTDGTMRSINIKTSSMKLKTTRTDSLIAYKLDWHYTTNNNTQR